MAGVAALESVIGVEKRAHAGFHSIWVELPFRAGGQHAFGSRTLTDHVTGEFLSQRASKHNMDIVFIGGIYRNCLN